MVRMTGSMPRTMTTPTETRIYRTRLHPIVFVAPIVWMGIAGILLFQQANETSTGLAGFIALVALGFAQSTEVRGRGV